MKRVVIPSAARNLSSLHVKKREIPRRSAPRNDKCFLSAVAWYCESESQRRQFALRRASPILCGAPRRHGAQLTRQDFPPQNDGGIRPAQALVLTVSDAALAGLHRDVLNNHQVRMLHVRIGMLPGHQL